MSRLSVTPEKWEQVSCDFDHRWNYYNNYYNCGVAIKKPTGSRYVFFNYKKFHSVILMALADANYQFLYVDQPLKVGLVMQGHGLDASSTRLSLMYVLASQTDHYYRTTTQIFLSS